MNPLSSDLNSFQWEFCYRLHLCPLYVIYPSSWLLLNLLCITVILVLGNLVMMCLGLVFFSFLDLCIYSFIIIWKLGSYYFIKYFFPWLFFGNYTDTYIRQLEFVPHSSWMLCSFYFNVFFLSVLFWLTSIAVYLFSHPDLFSCNF